MLTLLLQAAATPQLLRWVSLNRRSSSYPYSYAKRASVDPSTVAFASLATTQPSLLRSVEILHCRFTTEDVESSKDRDVKSEAALLPALGSMANLRRAHFEPYINASAFVSALHPDVRLEVAGPIAPARGILRLDGPQFERVVHLDLNLDGDMDWDEDHAKAMTLHLPKDLTRLELRTTDQIRQDFVLSLAAPADKLVSVEIEGRHLEFDSFAPFFRSQGPLITSLALVAVDLAIAIDDEWYKEPPDWDDPLVRAQFIDRFGRIVPVVALCTHLTTLEIFNVHLPHLFQTQHPTLRTVLLLVEQTAARLSSIFGDDEDLSTDQGFGQVSLAIQELHTQASFPKLRTIRYKTANWDWVLRAQWYNDYGPWGLQRAIAQAGLVLLDAEGVAWEDRLAGDQYVEEEEEEENWSYEEEEEEEDEDEDEGDEGEAVPYPIVI